MRLGVVTTSYPRFAGDLAGAFVGEHVAWLRAQGHEVEVVAAGDGECAPREVGVARVTGPAGLFYRGGAPDALEARPRLLWATLAFTARMTARVAAGSWDAIIGHWLVPAAVAAVAKPGLPLSAIAHSGDVDLLCKRRLATPVAALLSGRGAKLSFVAEHLRERFADAVHGPLRAWVRAAEITPMGVDVARLARGRSERSGRRVVFMGRLVPIKGVDVLCRALPELTRCAEVLIAGGGPMAARVAEASTRWGARYLGVVEGAERDRLLRSADVVVIPSIEVGGRREGAPVTAFEAMASGAAVVAARTGGLAELPASCVRFFEPGRADQLASAAALLVADDARRRAQVERARALVEMRDWSQVGPRLMPPDRARVRKQVRSCA